MRFTEEEARFFSQSLDDDPNICDEGFLLRRDQNAKDARKAQTKLRCRMPSLSLIDQEKRSPELESQAIASLSPGSSLADRSQWLSG